VIVYAHRSFPLAVTPFLHEFEQRVAALSAHPGHDTLTALLIDFGEAESAVTDALLPDRDEERAELRQWRAAARAVADAFCASATADRDRLRESIRTLPEAIAALHQGSHPETVQARTAEGFTCYGLYPEQYIDAAERLVVSLRPESVFCLGLRSIGTVLAHVVASTLASRGVRAEVRSLRPRGHPYDRRIVVDHTFTHALTTFAPSHVAIVDEGPGLSGSSLAAGVDAAAGAGMGAERIVIMPAWDAPVEGLRSERARQVWAAHPRVIGTYQPSVGLDGPITDLAAGRWRGVVAGSEAAAWPAVQPQHERVKFLSGPSGHRLVSRFAGLGRYGQAKMARASALADAGFSPAPRSLVNGFLVMDWVEGQMCPRPCTLTPRLADYLAYMRGTFASGERDNIDEVSEMMQVNTHEGLGAEYASAAEILARKAAAYAEPRVAVDGRLLSHEWIDGASGLFKVDALDHHADDFFPGCRDIAWDVAGGLAEVALTPELEAAMISRYTGASGDTTIGTRLPFYRAAYLAYRLGYTTLAAETLGGCDDGIRFRKLQSRYRRSLAALLRRPDTTARY
jgi:hypothetical protein